MVEVPDKEDDSSFRKWEVEQRKKNEVTSLMVAMPEKASAKAQEAPCHKWLKPFGAEWTWRKVLDAKTESEA